MIKDSIYYKAPRGFGKSLAFIEHFQVIMSRKLSVVLKCFLAPILFFCFYGQVTAIMNALALLASLVVIPCLLVSVGPGVSSKK